MRRIFAIVVCLAMSLATAGVANAELMFPTRDQQAVDIVIARALAQRGVPFAYGGGTVAGPSLGNGSTATVNQSAATVPGAVPGGLPGAVPAVPPVPPVGLPGLTPVPVAVPAPVPAPPPRVVGFDASGLMVYAFAGVGLKLPRTSGEQYLAGRKVLPSQALPGDLLFYGPNGSQSVAMFIGNGQMIEVGDSVQVTPVRTEGMTPYLARYIN
ncbi:NlpC/P60 family peptidoglycan-binding protein RipD [Mycolicibacterium sp. F2034L]|uniref:NlpC/P60 family peptidoglycan-binding protein RipD n=1 Tax=Mycolicibacterium sp. F2034L TaxID=2926422 RepID=UPI001FF2EE48|nr:NlpC/P60 family peptidoglycan-binding protein RipD [Mycolicibacterium sp. F2034L]MCK0174191.1 NlpC/P60 family peptidoglycan-binding protein RipD [Mycolicibacterium sp. F2034L]